MEPHIYGVTEVNQLVKGLLDSAPACLLYTSDAADE